MPERELCVIFNPAAGKQRGKARLAQIRNSWGRHAVFRPTLYSGHAVALAEQAAAEGFNVVAAAGGDGTAHEVLNGLMRTRRPDVRFSIIPIGSANDYAFSLGLDHNHAPPERAVDVGVVRAPGGKQAYFGCCLGLGFNGCVTWESRRIHRLQGVFLYGLAAIRAMLYHFRCPPMTLHIDDDPPWTTPTLLFTALIGKREGGFVLAPRAEVDDGLFDFVHAANLSRWEILKFLPRLALFGPPEQYPKIRQGRCRRVTVRSEAPLIVHTDGEFFCLPGDRIKEVAIEIMPAALRVAPLAPRAATPRERSNVTP
jgi:diacylglycerol kinase family enzyme